MFTSLSVEFRWFVVYRFTGTWFPVSRLDLECMNEFLNLVSFLYFFFCFLVVAQAATRLPGRRLNVVPMTNAQIYMIVLKAFVPPYRVISFKMLALQQQTRR